MVGSGVYPCPLEAPDTGGNLSAIRSQLDRSQDLHAFLAGASLRTHLALRVLLI
jgi:hypothetical protein